MPIQPDLIAKINDHILSMKDQKDDILDDLKKIKTPEDKYKQRKLAFNIEKNIGQFCSKIISYGITSLESPEALDKVVDENEIKQLVRELVLQNEEPYNYDVYSGEEIQFEFIKRKKCDLKNAENVFKRLIELGITLCPGKKLKPEHDFAPIFDITKFAVMRHYISKNELFNVKNIRQKKRDELDTFESKRRNKFEKKSKLLKN